MNIGDEVIVGGQIYRLTGWSDYTTKTGAPSLLEHFVSHCCVCGDEFDLARPYFSKLKYLNRRCRRHKRPGARA